MVSLLGLPVMGFRLLWSTTLKLPVTWGLHSFYWEHKLQMLKLHGLCFHSWWWWKNIVYTRASWGHHIMLASIFIWLAKIRSAALSEHVEGIFQIRRQFLWRFFKAASATHSALKAQAYDTVEMWLILHIINHKSDLENQKIKNICTSLPGFLSVSVIFLCADRGYDFYFWEKDKTPLNAVC